MFVEEDIHTYIKKIESNSIDCIYTNPPFGITCNKWDKPLDWDNLWPSIWRVLKPNGVAIIHASMPFSYTLTKSQRPKYHYIWVKKNSTTFFLAKKQPMRLQEEIYIFYKNQPTYNPQMIGDKIYKEGRAPASTYYGNSGKQKNEQKTYVGRYPTNVLYYKEIRRGGKSIPDEMIEFFIKTYTNEGDLILDMTCHNDVVYNVVNGLKRKYLGVDIKLDDELKNKDLNNDSHIQTEI